MDEFPYPVRNARSLSVLRFPFSADNGAAGRVSSRPVFAPPVAPFLFCGVSRTNLTEDNKTV